MKMIGYFGFKRETAIELEVVDLGCGAGQITCPECGGDGDWKKFHPDPTIFGDDPYPCVDCKGTGKVLISI